MYRVSGDDRCFQTGAGGCTTYYDTITNPRHISRYICMDTVPRLRVRDAYRCKGGKEFGSEIAQL